MGKKTLLIVDDEDKLRIGLETYIKVNIEWLDYIYTARNGQEALEIIFKYKPDVMLLDVQMPIKDGFEVMKEAKEVGICPKTIILSGYEEFKYAQKAIRLGAIDYILKPCRVDEIKEKINAIFEIEEEKEKEKEENPIIEIAKKYIEENYEKDISLVTLAEIAKVSPAYLSTLFTKYESIGFIDFLNKYRIEQAKLYLKDYTLKTYEVAFKVGFKDEKYFSKVFKKHTGYSPTEYKKKEE